MMFAPQRADAQGVNAGGTVVDGAAFIDNGTAGQTTVDVFSPTAVINWQPFEQSGGGALTYLPANNTLLFRASQQPDFAVLNRILPSSNNDIAVINGNVISRITNPATGAQMAGGFVAFYSPTGLLIGSTATFDVGSLLLTTLDTSPASFANFANGGNLNLAATPGSTARIQINPGAQISALAENSFFAVVAADVQMLGTARVNGSHAYVAGEVVNLSVSNGLFNISIPVGTAAGGTVVELGGTVGGPSSTGAGDNHILYAVARASADPISMIFRGNLGFDPAQSAGIVNGEIILSANYNVFGRTVDGGSISDGIDAVFNDGSELSTTRADIFLEDFDATSSILAIGTHRTQVTTINRASSIIGNLIMVGRERSELTASNGQSLTITGDVLVDARDYGVVSSSLQTLDAINAQGGTAFIDAFGGGMITINGNALVTAEAFAGADDINLIGGIARGGQALIGSTGGSLTIDGNATIRADAFGSTLGGIVTGAEARGGLAQFFAIQGGNVSVGQDVTLTARAFGAEGDTFSPSTVSDAFGGSALISIFDGGGTLSVGGNLSASANAVAGGVNASTGGALADAGEAAVSIDSAGTITIEGGLVLLATAQGGNNGGGAGGNALGGAARARTLGGGAITVGGDFTADATAMAGDGFDGGDAFGGVAGANAITGTINLLGSATALTSATGGDASIGFGGTGGVGRGGNAFFQANGTLNETAALSIALDALVIANGFGGRGGQADDGAGVQAGMGGIGYGGDAAVPNQADANFNSGAYLLAGGDNGSIEVGGSAIVNAVGTGGNGGFGSSTQDGGLGGDGFGGVAASGLLLFGTDGSLGQGRANFGSLSVIADGFGGRGGFSTGDFPSGEGGDGTGGRAILSVQAGDVTASGVDLLANGIGGAGSTGGVGTGGEASLSGGLGGTATLGSINARTFGIGGEGFPGGAGFGGDSFIRLDGIDLTVDGDVNLTANGTGGISFDGPGADGTGGRAFIEIEDAATPGIAVITGNAAIEASGFGGIADFGNLGGRGTGGTAYVQAQGGGLIRLGSLQVTASGLGGEANPEFDDTTVGGDGGVGVGGTAELRSFGSGSEIIIERNTPVQFSGPANGDGAILAALGIGGASNGGSGAGGDGIGGNIGVLARQGGSIVLPANPINDPDSVGLIRLIASGFGGGSSVDGGRGGDGFGGRADIEADGTGSSIVMGETLFTVFSEGGSSLLSTSNVTGGDAFGGMRSIRVLNGGEATLALVGGLSGGEGGDGSGSGDGGDAIGGRNLVELNGGTLNIIGVLGLNDQSTGGDGNRGGDVFSNGESGVIIFNANDSTITFTPDAQGAAGITLGGASTGGNGAIAGGNAQGALTLFSLTNTNLSGGFLRINPSAVGGSATSLTGQGGSATVSPLDVNISGSIVSLVGEIVISANATGGDGGSDAGGTGGEALTDFNEVSLRIIDSSLTVAASQTSAGILRLQTQARGGSGDLTGNATSALVELEITNSDLTVDQLFVETLAFADFGTGATARSNAAEVQVNGSSRVSADLIQISADAVTGLDGSSRGGFAALRIGDDSPADITAVTVNLTANASGSNLANAANVAGQFSVNIASGNLNAQDL
ncbi:MAG: hypothetical protein NWP98_10895, partial [Erythrobacter sp.]|nr:hypothetical protein [Erythrobacter sp.]